MVAPCADQGQHRQDRSGSGSRPQGRRRVSVLAVPVEATSCPGRPIPIRFLVSPRRQAGQVPLTPADSG
jgi:hypothetical protein